MNGTTLRTRHTTPAPSDQPRLTLLRAREGEAWQALLAAGERLARAAWAPHDAPVARRTYAASLLAWRAARHALDLALVPAPGRPTPTALVPAAPGPRRAGRRPHAKRTWWRPARG